MEIRKSPTEDEVQTCLRQAKLTLPPLRFKLRKVQPKYPESRLWDFEIEARWNDQSAVFAIEYKSLFTPKAFDQALNQCQVAKLPKNIYPMLMLPYLRPSQLEELESKGISGVDWCGNGVVIVADRFRVFRSGGRNQFATYSPIKNIYRKNTSMVARALLTSPQFGSVGEILAEVNRRDVLAKATERTPVTLGTVSKALKQLDADLIVERGQNVRLLQADKLLDQLQQNYEPPSATPLRLKVEGAFDQLPQLLSKKIENNVPLVATGLSSVGRYATMQREEILSLYCPDAQRVQSLLGGRPTDRFPNIELIETVEQPVYFDARQEDGFYWASPVQTWLELMSGDKRDQETADQVRDYILRVIHGGK
jgi:hypothetical protein